MDRPAVQRLDGEAVEHLNRWPVEHHSMPNRPAYYRQVKQTRDYHLSKYANNWSSRNTMDFNMVRSPRFLNGQNRQAVEPSFLD